METKTFQLEIKPPIVRGNPSNPQSLRIERWHWQDAIKKSAVYSKWRTQLQDATLRIFTATKVEIHCSRFSSRKMDYDNLVASFRPFLNALVRLGMLKDDSPRYITVTYSHEHAPIKQSFVLITMKVFEYETNE